MAIPVGGPEALPRLGTEDFHSVGDIEDGLEQIFEWCGLGHPSRRSPVEATPDDRLVGRPRDHEYRNTGLHERFEEVRPISNGPKIEVKQDHVWGNTEQFVPQRCQCRELRNCDVVALRDKRCSQRGAEQLVVIHDGDARRPALTHCSAPTEPTFLRHSRSRDITKLIGRGIYRTSAWISRRKFKHEARAMGTSVHQSYGSPHIGH